MLLFQKRFHAGLVDGAVRLTFRLWDRPRVKPGGRYRVHPIGVVLVDAIERTSVNCISEADAKSAGFATRAELLEYLAPVAKAPITSTTNIFKVALRHVGDGDRVEIAMRDELTEQELHELEARLVKLDGSKPWTRDVLTLIAKDPRVAASKLAAKLGREPAPFKVDVRKLKRLGLTMSFEVGYELSPRGRRFLERSRSQRRRR